jgi:hypothetical protein
MSPPPEITGLQAQLDAALGRIRQLEERVGALEQISGTELR